MDAKRGVLFPGPGMRMQYVKIHLYPCLCMKAGRDRKQHPSFCIILFYYFPQYILPHGSSRVDFNSNVFILFHNSKHPEIRQGKHKHAPLVFTFYLLTTLNYMTSTEPITINRVWACNVYTTLLAKICSSSYGTIQKYITTEVNYILPFLIFC